MSDERKSSSESELIPPQVRVAIMWPVRKHPESGQIELLWGLRSEYEQHLPGEWFPLLGTVDDELDSDPNESTYAQTARRELPEEIENVMASAVIHLVGEPAHYQNGPLSIEYQIAFVQVDPYSPIEPPEDSMELTQTEWRSLSHVKNSEYISEKTPLYSFFMGIATSFADQDVMRLFDNK